MTAFVAPVTVPIQPDYSLHSPAKSQFSVRGGESRREFELKILLRRMELEFAERERENRQLEAQEREYSAVMSLRSANEV